MEVYNDSSGPAIDPGVLRRLKAFDSSLTVTFSRYAIDPLKGIPIEVVPENMLDDGTNPHLEKRAGHWYVVDPCHYVWTKTTDGDRVLAKTIPIAEGVFSDKHIKELEQDRHAMERLVAFLDAKFAAQKASKDKAKENWKDWNAQLAMANKKRIHDFIEEGKVDPTRDAKVYSYEGQGNRATPGKIIKSSKEAGWESPE